MQVAPAPDIEVALDLLADARDGRARHRGLGTEGLFERGLDVAGRQAADEAGDDERLQGIGSRDLGREEPAGFGEVVERVGMRCREIRAVRWSSWARPPLLAFSTASSLSFSRPSPPPRVRVWRVMPLGRPARWLVSQACPPPRVDRADSCAGCGRRRMRATRGPQLSRRQAASASVGSLRIGAGILTKDPSTTDGCRTAPPGPPIGPWDVRPERQSHLRRPP